MKALRLLLYRLLPSRLKRQLQLMVTVSVALTIVLFGTYTIEQQTSLALANIENQAAAVARSTALASIDPVVTDKLDALEELVLHSAQLPQVLDIHVLSPQGGSLAHALRPPGGEVKAVYEPPLRRQVLPGTPQPLIQRDDGQLRVIAWHPIVAGAMLGWVRVDMDSALLKSIRDRIWLGTLAIGAAVGLASILLMSWLISRPVRAIGQARDFAVGLERIEGQQLTTLGGPEETIALGQALNGASVRLFKQRQTIEDSFGALMRQEAAVAEANEQLRAIFSLSPDALLSFDVQGRVRFANEAFFRITGLQTDEVLDQPEQVVDELLRLLCADDALYPGLAAFFPGHDAAEQAVVAHKRITLQRPAHAVLELVGLLGESTSVSKLLYLRDVTQASEVERMKSEFLHTAAHELRTPMTAIHSCIDLLRLRDFEPPRRKQLLDMVHRHSLALMRIVDELLDLARLEARSDADFKLEGADLREVVKQAVDDFVPPQGRSAPELVLPTTPLSVRIDASKLAQVVGNLLSNAYKYSHEGAVHVRVNARGEAGGESGADATGHGHGPGALRFGFEVQDHGIGMTAEQLARVCERFYRADASGHVLGTGLGMSIVKELVELMHGRLELTSEHGMGTTVGVWLQPEDQSLPVQAAAPAPHVQSEPAASPVQQKEKSLHAEDVQAL